MNEQSKINIVGDGALMQRKPILCLDFDGVCHSYASGWKGAAIITDPAVPGLFDFLLEASRRFEIQVFSSRSLQAGGIAAMVSWFHKEFSLWQPKDGVAVSRDCDGTWWMDFSPKDRNQDGERVAVYFPKEKPAAFITIDDRALTFTGVWPDIEMLKNFKPWNKK